MHYQRKNEYVGIKPVYYKPTYGYDNRDLRTPLDNNTAYKGGENKIYTQKMCGGIC